jgi:hypothetical protein
MSDDRQNDLLSRLRARRAFDDRWQFWNFVGYQIFLGLSIIASFGSAIVAASSLASPVVVAILAAIPGTVIVLDRGFMLSRRWRWHNTMSTKLLVLEQRLLLENTSIEEVSSAMSALLIEMESAYPARSEIDSPVSGKQDKSAG